MHCIERRDRLWEKLKVKSYFNTIRRSRWIILEEISTFLKKTKNNKEKQYDKLKRTLQKSIRKIGSKYTLENLKTALFYVDGLEELKEKLIERKEFERKNFDLELKLHGKDMRIARLEDELEKSRLKNMEMARLGEVAEKAKSEKRGKGKK